MTRIGFDEACLERMVRAVEKVRERLRRACQALDRAGVPYAVAGGNAVAAWVSRVDEAAVRNTQDVDILIRRSDLEAATQALATAGFVYRHVASVDLFLDGPEAKAREEKCPAYRGAMERTLQRLPPSFRCPRQTGRGRSRI
jgi:hypothetical protein